MNFDDFASRFEFKKANAKGFMTVCPAHADSRTGMSLSVSRGKENDVLLKCFAGCDTASIVGALGLKMRDLFAKERAVKFTPPPIKENGDVKQLPDVKPVIEKIYSYQNATGAEVYQAIRMKPKSFRQRHRDENGNWIWTMDGVVRVLYNLPQIMKSHQVIVVEGEKDADNLCELGFTATCNVGGAGKWLEGYSESLRGKDVILCGDNDEPGKKHIELVFESIAGVAKTVKIIKLPDSIKDASDYILALQTKEEAKAAFEDLISAAYPHIKGIKLPLYSLAEIENDYKRLVRSMHVNAFALEKWLPSFKKIRPLVAGELVVIIGDTGIGKTALAQSIIKAAQPMASILFQMELPKEVMFERFASMVTKQRGEEIEKTFQDYEGESLAAALDAAYPKLVICPESGLTVKQIERYIMSADLKLGERPKLVIMDYLQLMSAQNSTRREKISDIIEGLKVVAKTTQTIIIIASQVSRPSKDDDDWEPHLHSAKESSSIEASCGLMLGVWRDKKDGALNIRVLKSTKGGTGTFVKCNFDGARMIITERTEQEEE